jgi:hypothetical protein
MSNIILINASPKRKDSASGVALQYLRGFLKSQSVVEYSFTGPKLPEGFQLGDQDILVIAFPLYVDGAPSHLLSCMEEIEKRIKDEKRKNRVYAIANCGFYEAKQNAIALAIMENWCERSYLQWQYGLGISGGGMLSLLQKESGAKGPMRNAAEELKTLANSICQNAKKQENHYVQPNFPRLLYKLAAEMEWRHMIRSNAGKRRDLFRKIDLNSSGE